MRIPCLTLVFVTICCCFVASNPVAIGNKAKKSNPERQPALIAIEIVNSTSSKNNTKRTIESSLSYGGYNGNNFYYKTQDGKFEIYPYSQHDIPPLNVHNDNVRIQPAYSYTVGKPGQHRFHHSQAHPSHQSYQSHQQQQHPQYHYQQQQHHQQTEQLPYSQQNFHKTAAYSQPTYTSHQAAAQPVVYPTLFFTTLDQSGQIGDVTEHLPQNYNKHQQQLIPVIILRVPSDQLITSHDSNAAYAPSNYASHINPLHVQELLATYLQQHTYQITPTNTEQEAAPHQHVQQHESDPNYTIQENYPSVAHTRIVYNTKPVKNTAATAAYYYKKPTTTHPHYYQAPIASQTEQPQEYKSYKTSEAQSPESPEKEQVSNQYLPTATHETSKYKAAASPENEYVYYYGRTNDQVNYVPTLPQGYVYENANAEQVPQGYEAPNNEQTQYILVHPDQAAGAYPIDMAALYYQAAYSQPEQENHQAHQYMTNVEQPPPARGTAPRQGNNPHRTQHSETQDHTPKVYNYHVHEHKNKRSDKKTRKNGETSPVRVRNNKRE